MSRKARNTICIVIMLLLCGSIVLTGYMSGKASADPGGNAPAMTQSQEQPPDKPDGDSSMEAPPEKPDGNDQAQPPDKPGSTGGEQMGEPPAETGNNYVYLILFGIESLLLSLLVIYLLMSGANKKTFRETFINRDKITIYVLAVILLTGALTYTDYLISNAVKGNGSPEPGQSMDVSYSAVKEISGSTTETGGKYVSSSKDENAVLVSGDIEVDLSDIQVDKSGDSDGGDNTSFYGTNSGITAKDGADLTLKNVTIKTDAAGADGVFSCGGSASTDNTNSDGTTVTISDSYISTSKDNSGGIMTTGGGTMNVSDLTVDTSGISSAAIRSDRGGGKVDVDGGTYRTSGAGSPAIYSTADISVSNASLISAASEGAVIEGKNSISLDNVTLTDTNSTLNGQSTTYKNIFLYQSMSGDADEGVSEFSAKDSKITTNKGDTLYITNTSSDITLENNTIVNNDPEGNFLRAQKDSWGNEGSNGGIVKLMMKDQKAKGDISIDSISTLDMTMDDGSYYEGTINGENSAKEIKLTLDKTSRIKLTGNSYLSSLNNEDTSNGNIDFNGYTLYVNGKAVN